MERTIACMTKAIADILQENEPSIYLYGSCTMADFRPGWSDIDLLVLTQTPISPAQAEALLTLRQNLPKHYPDIQYARACEGGMMSMDAFTKGYPDTVVYWGTSGERITDRYHLDAFSRWTLHHDGRLLYGPDVHRVIPIPTPNGLHFAVARHLQTILEHGRGGRNLYTFGWLLDVARGLYTLRHDAVISKTAAGEWALREHLCPDEAALQLALEVRQDPQLIQQETVLHQAEALTPAIQRFAAVLQAALEARGIPIPT